jgi:hypothetical protein
MRRANAAFTTSTNSLNVLSTIFNGERRMTTARDWTHLHRWRCMYQNMICLSNACFSSNGSCGGAGASNVNPASNCCGVCSNAGSNGASNVFVVTCCDEIWKVLSNLMAASNTSSNALSNFDSNCCVWTSNNFSNFLASNYKSNIDFASNTAWWTSNALSNLDSNCCVWASNLVFWASNNFSNFSGGSSSGGGTDECCAFTCNLAVWTSNALSNFSNSCDCSCAMYYSDVVTIPAAGPVIVNHNFDLTNPSAFIITVFDEDTNTWLTPKISTLTANSLELTGTTLSLNARVNIQRNEPCGSNGNAKVCAYEYINVINSTQTLSDGTVATVSGSTGGTLKTWQGITGYNVGDLEDNEKITIDFSKTVTRLRVTIDAAERISGVYEQLKLFLNGAPYAVQASQMTTPITAGGRFALIDGGFTLDPVSVADDASALIIIEPAGGITSFSVQDIRVSGTPNGAVVRVEALICKP